MDSKDLDKFGVKLSRPLKYLDLQENNLKKLPIWMLNMNSIPKYKYIKRIDLSNNEITRIPSGVFKDLFLLTYLNLSSNKIREIKAGTFVKLLKLGKLFLKNNPSLTTLHKKAFYDLPKLEILDLFV